MLRTDLKFGGWVFWDIWKHKPYKYFLLDAYLQVKTLRSKLPGNFISHHSPCTPHNHYSEFCHHDISVSLLRWGGFFLYNDLARFWCWHELYWPLTMICNCVFFHILWKEFVYSWCLVSGKIHQWSFNLGLKFSLYKILNYALDLFSRYEAIQNLHFFLFLRNAFK